MKPYSTVKIELLWRIQCFDQRSRKEIALILSPQPPAPDMRDHRGNMTLNKQGERVVCFLSQHLKAPLAASIMTF